MAWAIFTRRFLFDRRPKFAVAFDIKPKAEPQSWPRDVIEAAIEAGAAKRSRKTRGRDSATTTYKQPAA
jgi:hypothetical protein